jgi:uncharacterized membrane protein YjjP (DUF1212 family)
LDPSSKNDLKRIDAGVSRLTWAVVFASLLVCGTVLAINGLGLLSAALFIGAVVTLVRVLTV